MANIADLSKWQGNIDFGQLKNQVDFVILRVQAGYTNHDEKYKEYVSGCKANGIPFGTYAYFRGVSVPDSIAEAKCAMDLTDHDSKFFALDIEENSMRDLVSGGQAFIDYLKNKGMQKVGIYSGESFFNTHNLGAILCDFVWIAKYGPNDGQQHTKPNVACDLWQYTSSGHLNGISGNVDLNVLAGNKGLDYFTGTSASVQSQQTNNPVQPVSTGNPIVAKVQVIADNLNCRQHPDINSPVLFVAKKGQIYNLTAYINDWHEVIIDNNGHNGYLFGNNGQYLSLIRDNPQPTAPQTYTINPGDTLSKIAANNRTTVSQLQAWNNISNPDRIFTGQKIRVK